MSMFVFASWSPLNSFEAVMALLVLLYTVYFMWTVNRTCLIHRNLRRLLTIFSFFDIVTVSWRMVELVLPSEIINPNIHKVVKFSILMMSSLSLFDLLYERYHAVYHYRTYHEEKKPILLLGMLAAKILIFGICTFLRATIFMDSYYFTCILFSILTSSFFLMYLVFVKVTTALKKERENTYDVNMKYSIDECEKASTMLRFFVPFQASANMLMVGALTVILLHITPQLPDYVPLAHSLLYLLFICTRILMGNSIAIYKNEILKNIVMTDMRRICLKKRVAHMAPDTGNQVLTAMDGSTPIRIDRLDVGNVRMEALDEIWNSDKAPDAAIRETLKVKSETVSRAAKESQKRAKIEKKVRVREQREVDPNEIEMDVRTNSTIATSYQSINSIV